MARISAVLIAAGEGIRMGRPKPLLPWHGVPLVEYQTASLLDAGVAEVIVVLGHQHETVAPLVKGGYVRYVINDLYRQGKTTSIKAGLREISADAEGILLLAVDQPRPPGITSTVIDSHVAANAIITSPRYQGHGGHPLVFSRRLMDELGAITEEGQGIREVLEAHRDEVNEVEFEDPIVRLDLNSLEDYEDAKVRYGA